MTNTSTARQSHLLTIPWQMPIVPEAYPGRNPRLTRKEKTIMKQYIKAAGSLSGLHAKRVLDQLARFDQPFVDTIRLVTKARYIAHGRRHLFRYMLQTGLAFWAWPKETWVEAIQAAPRVTNNQGVRLWMTLLTYLFGNFLYVGASTSYVLMADIIFGKARMDVEVSKLYAPPVGIGYDKERGEHHRFRWLCAFTLLVNRHPEASALSASVIVTVHELLAEVASIGCIRGRRALMQLQRSLCDLGILDEPALLESTNKTPMRSPETPAEDLHARLQKLEAQIAKKQGKADRRSASMRALLQELAEVKAQIEVSEDQLKGGA